jgi:hypothetical protein
MAATCNDAGIDSQLGLFFSKAEVAGTGNARPSMVRSASPGSSFRLVLHQVDPVRRWHYTQKQVANC